MRACGCFDRFELPTDLPIMLSFQLDQRALVFSLIVAVASAVLFGLVPAMQATRTDLTAVMKAGDAVAPRRRRRWGRAVLVGGQVAVSVVLLVVAMFMYRGFREQLVSGPGYRTDHLLMMGFDTTLVRYSEAQSEQFFQQLAERARAVPGVTNVTLTTAIPMSTDSLDFVTIAPEGFQFPEGKENVTVLSSRIDEHYFDTLAIPLVQGRNFTVDDDLDAPRVGIVNQQLAQHYWPNQDPIGKRIRLNDEDKTWVADRRRGEDGQIPLHRRTAVGLRLSAVPPAQAATDDHGHAVCRRSGDARGPACARSSAASTSISRSSTCRTMEELYRMRAVSIFNVLITMVGSMGLMGLGLAIVGLYGLVAYAATRTDERDRDPHGDRGQPDDGVADGAAAGDRAGAGGTRRGPGGERGRGRVAGGGVSAGERSAGPARAGAGHPDRAGGDLRGGVHPGEEGVEGESDAGVEV